MRIKSVSFVLAFLLLAASAFAAKWTIDSFDDSSEPGDPDNYIAAESGSGLKPINPSQVSAQQGRLYVRQKFEDPFGDDEPSYQIFQGRATDASKSLGKISLDGIPYATLLKMKLFYAKNASGDDDLETVYFDGKDIYVEGDDPVYINLNGKMEELKPITARDYKISILSTPPGATVLIGNTDRGKTPATISVPSSKPVTVVVSLNGYYTVVMPVTPNDKQTAQESVNLTEKPPLVNPAVAFRTSMQTATASKDAAALKKLKADVQQSINNFTANTKKSVDAIMLKFPANPPKTSSESATDFSGRQTVWTNTQSRERDAMNKLASEHFKELKDLLAEIDGAAGEMDFSLKYEYIPNSAIEFTNLGIKDLTLSASVENSRISFNYEKARLGYGSLSKDEIADGQDDIHGVLKIWNSPNESGKYNSIYDIAFFYEETPLKMLSKGTLTVDGANSSSKNIEKDLNSRIAKYPKKSEWDKRDEAATLAALRAGNVGGGSSAPKREEAYYDEDEDDEEFEEEMEEQEEKDYSRYSAASSATDVFGNKDEYLFWTGMVFAAAAIGTGVMGFLQHKKYSEAADAIAIAEGKRDEAKKAIGAACSSADNPDFCVKQVQDIASKGPDDPRFQEIFTENGELTLKKGGNLYIINENINANTKVRDSYNTGRIIWFSAAAASAAISITLFAW